jgi:hypothetical protein
VRRPRPTSGCRADDDDDNVEKCGKTRQAADDSIVCWITKVTDTHSGYVIYIALAGNNGYVTALICYVYTYIACLIYNLHCIVASVYLPIYVHVFSFCNVYFPAAYNWAVYR